MKGQLCRQLSFQETTLALERWQGHQVRVELSHRARLGDIACVPESILQRIEPIPEELIGMCGGGLGLIFSDRVGFTIITLLVHEQLFDHGVEFDRELQIWLDDVDVIIERAAES
jgi:hypothetical protein